MTARRPRAARPALLAGGFGLLWLLALGGADLLDPRRIDWLLAGDSAQHLIGWLFFRQSEWRWPLGAIPDLAAPAGTTVGFTDAIPWLAVAARLAAPLLPEPFTFLGLWLVACFVLQGAFGARLLRTAGLDAHAAALGGCLLATAPILAFRIAHEALCGHFLILAALELGLRRPATPHERRRIVAAAFAWTAFAAGVHPYLALMVAGLCAAAIARLWLAFGLAAGRALGLCAALAATVLAVFALFGYLAPGTTMGAPGFGLYSADLLALLDPRQRSRLVPGLGSAGGQYEGFGYLGIGVLLLGAIGCFGPLARRPPPAARAPDGGRCAAPLVLAIAAFTVLAWSHRVTARGVPLLDYSAWTGPLLPLLETFRASGRFVWPLHYAVVTLACVGCARWLRDRPRALAVLFCAALALQAFEQLGHPVADRFAGAPPPVWSPLWEQARERYGAVSLYPPVIVASDRDVCDAGGIGALEITPYALLAHALGKPFNSAYVARADAVRARAACAVTLEAVRANRLDPRTLYLVAPAHLDAFRAAAPASRCGLLDGLWACVASANRDPLAAALRAPPRPVPEPGGVAQALAALAALLLARGRAPVRTRRCGAQEQAPPGPGQRWPRATLRRTSRARACGSPAAQGSARL